MGEQFITKFTEGFTHQQDVERERALREVTLFSSRPEVYDEVYRCRVNGPDVGAALSDDVVICDAGGVELQVTRANVVVGAIGGTEAAELRSAFRADPRACGMAKARVCEVPEIGGYLGLMLVREGGD